MTPPLYIALRFLTHRKRALLLSLERCRFRRRNLHLHAGADAGLRPAISSSPTSGATARSSSGRVFARVTSRSWSPRRTPRRVRGRRLYFEGITNPNEIMRVSRQFPDVVSCSPVLRGTVSARAGFENATVDLYGIDPALHARTTDILHQLIDGSFDDFRNNTSSIIIGSRLAELLQSWCRRHGAIARAQRRVLAIQCCSDRTCGHRLDRFDPYLLARQGCTGIAATAFWSDR